ncbi:MAG TPA: NAD(P)H-hydrate dehydratase [Beijerinckiaceae bacterium]|nr:NAD(P)H-hydrate dehydratase [Beijerinckiaceae bacterium]
MHRLLTTGEMRRADALAIAAGTPGYTLMLLAGEAVAETAAQMLGTRGRVLVLCGPGNNGGDGFVAARRLREMGHDVVLALLGNQERLKDDAARAAGDWTGEVDTVSGVRPGDFALVIDALFGAGLARDLDGEAARAVERMNASGRPILAVDIPSGIDGDTGALRGTAVRAMRTVTFARRKPGHLLLPGRAHCGSVAVADIGIADATIAATGGSIFANAPALWAEAFPRPTLDTHKYRRGHALVLSGAALHTGAARLAARGALRVGAGLVTLASPAEALAVNAGHLTAVMLRRCDGAAELAGLLADRRFNAVALGPALGVGASTREKVAAVLAADRAAVLDADALTSFEGDAAALARLAERCAQAPVLTPHEGEFARLFKAEAGVLDGASKLERARRAAALMHAIVVLKGADTVIAAPDERAAINENATPDLATAGSGDVLTGVVAGLLAQGMAPFEAACAGVWVHAEAGRRFGAGLISEDIPEGIPGVLATLRGDIPAIPRD